MFGKFVNDTGGEQDFAAMQHRAIEEAKLKAAIFFAHAHHGGLAQLNAVPLHFLTRELMKFPGNDRIAREESVDAARPRVTRISGVADQHTAAASGEE